MVRAVLLHALRESGLGPPTSGGDQASPARNPQGQSDLRPGAGSSRARSRRTKVHPAARLAVETLKELPYARWREYDPASTLRFHALRLRDVGMIKSLPQTIIAEGTDWRFLNELKQELKG